MELHGVPCFYAFHHFFSKHEDFLYQLSLHVAIACPPPHILTSTYSMEGEILTTTKTGISTFLICNV